MVGQIKTINYFYSLTVKHYILDNYYRFLLITLPLSLIKNNSQITKCQPIFNAHISCSLTSKFDSMQSEPLNLHPIGQKKKSSMYLFIIYILLKQYILIIQLWKFQRKIKVWYTMTNFTGIFNRIRPWIGRRARAQARWNHFHYSCS